MIVKIWPIKSDYAGDPDKVGGVEGLKNAVEYINDPEKVIVLDEDLKKVNPLPKDIWEEDQLSSDTNRVIEYMKNHEKIKGRYVSGYMCDPEDLINDFTSAKIDSMSIAASKVDMLGVSAAEKNGDTGAIAFHLVQSFPEDLEISDEEVHQCGLELCEKIGLHQALVCSHVHPMKDEKGVTRGKCKHNHILINAYIHPDKLDPEHPERIKYHDCKESYAQLRVWNDEIAIEHGLPIIRNPDDERTYSWYETDTANKGLSWKERIRTDIESAKRISSSWSGFTAAMQNAGYTIKEGKRITYIAPDGSHKARGNTLGKQYTKEGLELYWRICEYTRNSIDESIRDNTEVFPLMELVQQAEGVLTAAIPLGVQGRENRKYHHLPLQAKEFKSDALESYFDQNEMYEIFDEKQRPLGAATGAEIIQCIQDLQREKDSRGKNQTYEEYATPEEEYQAYRDKKKYKIYYGYINSKTMRPYRATLYDQYGRRRTTLELLFILAATILRNEADMWASITVPTGKENSVFNAPRNWKIQNMIDSIALAREEGIETPAQLDHRLDEAGAAYSRARSARNKTARTKEKMDMLNEVLSEYRLTKDIAEQIHSMDDGTDKSEMQEQYKDVIERYKKAKAVMYRYELTEEAQIADFEHRYKKIQTDLESLEERLDDAKENYRKLKKLSYNASLAENAQYCYGPDYTYDRAYEAKQQESEHAKKPAKKKGLDEQIETLRGDNRQSEREKESERKK